MATTRKDPLPAFCFKVSIDIVGGGDEPATAFFKSVSGLSFETEVIDVASGGVNDTQFRLVGRMKWKNLVLKQGFTKDSQLLKWQKAWATRDIGQMTRADGTIVMLDTALNPQGTWSFKAGWPCKWDMSEMDASKSEIVIETLEIAHEGLKFS
jgi:phage tail-like protein